MTDGAPGILTDAASFYQMLEQEWSTQFYYPNVYCERLFIDDYNKNKYTTRKCLPEYAMYYNEEIPIGGSKLMNAPLGGVRFRHTSILDTRSFLSSGAEFLKSKKALMQSQVDWNGILIKDNRVEWNGVVARSIVDCRGVMASLNPYFSDLTFRHAKGEILVLELDKTSELGTGPQLYNQRYWLANFKHNLWKFGATYQWRQLDSTPTDAGRNQLENEATRLLKVPYKVLDHQAAVRCVPKHNTPYAVWHKKHQNVGILTGLGSKGVILAPKFARYLLNHMGK